MKQFALPFLAVLFLANAAFAEDFLELVSKSTPELVQNAINAGAKLDDMDKYGRTPLMFAARTIPMPRSSGFSWGRAKRSRSATKETAPP